MSCLPKPALRGHFHKRLFLSLTAAVGASLVTGSLYYFLVKSPKEKRYEEFLKTYNAEAHTEDLLKWGYYQTVEPVKSD